MDDSLEQILVGQSRALELLAQGHDLESVLASLVETAEANRPDSQASVLGLDRARKQIARIVAPHLPDPMVQFLLEAGIALSASPCAAALHSGQPIWIENVETDPRARSIREIALEAGYLACWSQPIFDSSAELLGTVALWTTQSGPPSDREMQVLLQIAHVAGVVLERHETEVRQRQLVEAIESSGEAMIMTDHLGQITSVNPAFTRITGFDEDEAIGRTTDFLHSEKQDKVVYRKMWSQVNSGEAWSGRLIQTRRDGRDIHVALTIAPVRDVNGETTGFVGIEHDITDDIRREESLREAVRLAEDATRTKTSFLANMSHEIRTPMAAILGFAELLLDPGMDREEQEEMIHSIRRNGQHLVEILNSILDLSKIEAGGIVIEKVLCSPALLIAEAASMLRGRAREQGIELEVRIYAPFPETIETDPTRFRQILINLLGNAIKFTSVGAIEAQARWTECGKIEVAVIDSGIGIAEENIPTLFRPFTQAEASTTRVFGGTGLGLTISRGLVEGLGGTISVESEVGQGSTFTFTIDPGPNMADATFLDESSLTQLASQRQLLGGLTITTRNSKAS